MEWLMIIAFIVVSIMDSKKKSEQAKQQREQRQKMQGQQVYRSESQPKAAVKPESAKPAEKRQTVKKPENQMYGPLGEFLEELENWASAIDSTEHPAKPSGSPVKKPVSAKNVSVKQKTQKQSMQTAKKEPAALPTKTLMEMRPDREKREEHTKVAASVKPLTASVKPLKSAYENDEKCEHRIELNPNIQYSKQQQKETAQAAAIVKTDKDSLVQGIIWSEILGKPKAYQPNQPVFRTGRNR